MEMVCLAASVSSWNQRPGSVERVADFEALEGKILDKARHAGFADAIEYSDDAQGYVLTQEFQDDSFFLECYDEFRNESFWEELVIRLSDRDMARQIGVQAWGQLSEEQRRTRCADLEKRYWDEFSRHGIDRVVVVHPAGQG